MNRISNIHHTATTTPSSLIHSRPADDWSPDSSHWRNNTWNCAIQHFYKQRACRSLDLNAAEKRAVVGAAGDLQRLLQRLFHGSPVAPREVCLELEQRRNVSLTVGERRKRKQTSVSCKRLLQLKVESVGFVSAVPERTTEVVRNKERK